MKDWNDRHKAKSTQDAMEYVASFPHHYVFDTGPESQQHLGTLVEYCKCWGFDVDLDAVEMAAAARYCEESDLDPQKVMERWACSDLVSAVGYAEGHNQYTRFEYWRSSSIGC